MDITSLYASKRTSPDAAIARIESGTKLATGIAPGIVGTMASLLDAAWKSLDRDGREEASYIADVSVLLRVDHQPVKQGIAGTLARWQIHRVVQFINKNSSGTLCIGDLATAVGLSAAHFSRAFRRTTGETPGAYLRRHRVEQSQAMMLSSSESLAGIALLCGFSDQAHLSKCFRRIVGMPPGAWRRLRSAALRSSPARDTTLSVFAPRLTTDVGAPRARPIVATPSGAAGHLAVKERRCFGSTSCAGR
jgi:AraC family transcriptional regulator